MIRIHIKNNIKSVTKMPDFMINFITFDIGIVGLTVSCSNPQNFEYTELMRHWPIVILY